MDRVLAFLRARWAERSSRVQIVVLALSVAVYAGLVTFAQIEEFVSRFGTLSLLVANLIGPALGFVVPDHNRAIDAEAQADEALAAAVKLVTEAAERKAGPGAREASLAVTAAIERIGL